MASEKKHKSAPFSRGWLIAPVLFGVVLMLMPEAIRVSAERAIPSFDLGEGSIDDIDFNIFSGKLSVDDLEINRDGKTTLIVDKVEANLEWLKLLEGKIHLSDLLLDGAELSAIQSEDGQWHIVVPLAAVDADKKAVDTEPVELPRISVANTLISNIKLKVKNTESQGLLAIERIHLENLSSWENRPMTADIEAHWNSKPVLVQAELTPWSLSPRIQAKLILQDVVLNEAAALVGQPLKGEVNARLSIDALRDENGTIESTADLNITLSKLHTNYQQFQLAGETIAWQGAGNVQWSEEKGVAYSLDGDFQAEGLNASDTQQQIDIVDWSSLSIQGLQLNQDLSGEFQQLMVKDIVAIRSADKESSIVRMGEIDLEKVTIRAGKHIAADHLRISDAHYNLTLNEDGKLQIEHVIASLLNETVDIAATAIDAETADTNTEKVLARSDPQNEEASAQANGEVSGTGQSDSQSDSQSVEPSVTFSLQHFEMTGDSHLSFTDKRFSVPVKQQLLVDKLAIENLNQLKTDEATQLVLLGKLGEFSTVSLEGTAKPFAKKTAVDIKGEIGAIPLPSVSTYSEAYLGYHLTRGQYDHKFELIIDDKDLSMESQLFIRQLDLESVDPNKPQPVAKLLDVPLDFALDMLRDGNDNIALDVPIKGRLDQPDVHIDDVINNALGNALKSGATSFLKLALQPYGAALVAADMVRDRMSAVQLDPIKYPVGSSELGGDHINYISKITDLLKARPKLELTICALANSLDKEAMQVAKPEPPITESELVALADQRGKNIKRQLINEGVESRRLFVCQPKFKESAKNGVTLSM